MQDKHPSVPAATSPTEPQAVAELNEMLAGLETQAERLTGFAASWRAVGIGVAVTVGGSLVMATFLGLVAVTAMLARDESADVIAAFLPRSFALKLFVAAGGLTMALAGGYAAALRASAAPLWHAAIAGLLSIALNAAILPVLGDPGPVWLTGASTGLSLPCALLGGWLAAPVPATLVAEPQRSR